MPDMPDNVVIAFVIFVVVKTESLIVAPAESSPLPCGERSAEGQGERSAEGLAERSTSDPRKSVQSSSSVIFIISLILFFIS
jgi:hypothetical protein